MTPLPGLCYTGQKCSPEVLSCSLSPNVFSHPPAVRWDARPSGPHHRPGTHPALHRYAGPFPRPPRAVGLVHRMGALPERFRRLGRRPLLQGPARNGQPEIGYGLLPEYEHQATPPRLSAPPAAGPSNSPASPPSRPRPPPIMLPRRRCCTGWALFRPGLWARKGRGLFCAKSLDSIAKSALSPLHLPQLVP